MKSAGPSKISVALLLAVAVVGAAFTTAPPKSRHSSCAINAKRVKQEYPFMKVQKCPMQRNALFHSSFQRSSCVERPRLSLRRLYRKIVAILPTKSKVVALLFAALVWFQGAHLGGPKLAHAASAQNAFHRPPVERVMSTSGQETMLVRNTVTKKAPPKAARTGVNGKLAAVAAATVVLGPSAGLVVDYVKKKDGVENQPGSAVGKTNQSNREIKTFKKPSTEDPEKRTYEEKREKAQKKMVEDVLNNANTAQKRVSPQQEKNVGGSASKQQQPTSTTSPPAQNRVDTKQETVTQPKPRQYNGLIGTPSTQNGNIAQPKSTAGTDASLKTSPVQSKTTPSPAPTTVKPASSTSSSSKADAKSTSKPAPATSLSSAPQNLASSSPSPPKTSSSSGLKPLINTQLEKKPTEVTSKSNGKTGSKEPSVAPQISQSKDKIAARRQPKPEAEEKRLQEKYAKIEDLGERAYTILLDLGMIESTDGLDEEPFQ